MKERKRQAEEDYDIVKIQTEVGEREREAERDIDRMTKTEKAKLSDTEVR
jgi:hypothetical protein